MVSPHADDEVLGCGGLISQMNSDSVYIAQMTMGSELRKTEFLNLMEHCSINNYSILFDDSLHLKLDTIPLSVIITELEKIIEKFMPTIVAIPFPSFNQDHEVVYRACCAALRSKKKGQHMPLMTILYEYPQINWSGIGGDFQPNFYIDITKELPNKIKMMKFYESQLVDETYAVSLAGIKNMANYRGREISVSAAEAYYLKRLIINF
ncbi:PIG-L deacetylase family protein [Paenibacillus polysaccharolyticus]|uniref:PIG-L deacetylase family protein n=1 Tax=Paenibacillus polysaccharolyticus TaxID=582692 RepID=UPI0033412B6E